MLLRYAAIFITICVVLRYATFITLCGVTNVAYFASKFDIIATDANPQTFKETILKNSKVLYSVEKRMKYTRNKSKNAAYLEHWYP